MPILYTSIAEEHRAVREAAGLFDVSHMGVLEVSGEDAADFLDALATNYGDRIVLHQEALVLPRFPEEMTKAVSDLNSPSSGEVLGTHQELAQ